MSIYQSSLPVQASFFEEYARSSSLTEAGKEQAFTFVTPSDLLFKQLSTSSNIVKRTAVIFASIKALTKMSVQFANVLGTKVIYQESAHLE